MHRVRDLLHGRETYSVQDSETVSEVAHRMAGWHVGAILVMSEGELGGVFSERDLMVRVVLAGVDPAVTPVSAVMSRNLATVQDSAPVEAAMEIMHEHNCLHLPVLRGREVAGFLSMRDVMTFELSRKSEELQQMRAYIQGST